MARRSARILHAPWNVGGNPVGLSRAERELGFRSDVLVLAQHPFGFPADFDLEIEGTMSKQEKRKRVRFALKAMARYDVFHFNFGQTIVHSLDAEGQLQTEVPWLKRLGKTVIATFQGDDARPPDANPFAGYDEASIAEQGVFQSQRRDLMLRHADRVFFLNPDLREWLPGAEFRPYASFDPQSVKPTPLPGGAELVVAHAPSARSQKGTAEVIDAVEALRAEGVAVRLELIEGAPRAEAIERTKLADVVIDQVGIGWYGGYSVEAMSLGRPVMCRIRDEKPGDNPFGDDLPVLRTTAETLRDDLREILADGERRQRVAREGREFAERVHDPRRVARQNLDGLVRIPAEPAVA